MESAEGFVEEVPSLCPECGAQAPATIFEREGRIYQRSTCGSHPGGATLIFSDAGLYRKLNAWNDAIFGKNGHPVAEFAYSDRSDNPPTLAVIDITNRCNYRCPLCFAEAADHRDYYSLPVEKVQSMLAALLEDGPVPCTHIQFSGGEPTLHPEFPRILRMAREMGFTHIQAATNGSRFVDPDYAALCEEAGLQTLYLQFDGMDDAVYVKLRGQPLLANKIRMVENIERGNMRIVLVPTIAVGVNVDQIRPIFEFALTHSRHITGISIQPAADIGRVQVGGGSAPALFNLADLALEFGKQTGLTRTPDDWFPLNAVSMITRGLSRMRGDALPHPTCDAHCSLGTYFYIDERNRPTCVSRFFDLERFLKNIGRVPAGRGLLSQPLSRLLQMELLASCFNKRQAPEGMTFQRLLHGLEGWEDKSKGRAPGWDSTGFNGMFVAGMHFMDRRNYNYRRLKRCIIQYVTARREVIPFCSYNAGPRLRTGEEMARRESDPAGQPGDPAACADSVAFDGR